jgi:Kef-type K+ transport system membrane component KefB
VTLPYSARMGGTGPVDSTVNVALSLALILVLAKIAGHFAVRVGQPAVLGELSIGLALGVFRHFAPVDALASDPTLAVLAQLGMIVLLFEVGLELTVRDLSEVGVPAVVVALLGTVATFALGALVSVALMPEQPALVHAFVGASITATSVGITARVLKDSGQTKSREARIILGAAILDDILALVILALMTGILESARPTPLALLLVIAKTAGFLVVAVVGGVTLTPHLFRLASRLRSKSALLTFGLAFCFALAWCAHAIGLAPIVGAFVAGLVLSEEHSHAFTARGERSLLDVVDPVSSFLVPIFFVLMGMHADLRVLAHLDAVLLAAALTAAATLGKMACAAGTGKSVRRLSVAVGMIPRGEVSLIYASLGATLIYAGAPVIGPKTYAALVIMVLTTTLVTPTLLKRTFRA